MRVLRGSRHCEKLKYGSTHCNKPALHPRNVAVVRARHSDGHVQLRWSRLTLGSTVVETCQIFGVSKISFK